MSNYDWKCGKEYREIRYELCDGVAKISINRPERRNAFTPLTVMEMYDAFSEARDDASVGVILLTGVNHGGRHEDEAFCSGGDQKKRGNGGYVGEDNIPRLNVLDLQRLIRVVPKPVIAMVNGYAIGGGHVLSILCDLTIAADTAKFGQTGPKVGSFDAGYGAGYLAAIVGQKKAREIWYLCRQYTADEALEMGPREQGRALRRFGRRVHGLGRRDDAVFPHSPALHEGIVQRRHRRPCGSAAAGRRRHTSVLHHRRGQRGPRRLQGEARPRLHPVPEVSVGCFAPLPQPAGGFLCPVQLIAPKEFHEPFMIDIFESTAQLRPEAVFFTAVDRRGNETAYTYRQARLIASQLARRLRDKGVFPGDAVAVDLPNGPMYVFLALAAAYGGFALVALNHRLTDAEKLTRVLELERAGLRVAYTVDAAGEPKLFEAVCNSLLRNERAGRVDDSLGGSVEDAIHFAERAAHVFDSSHRALIMFTSGTTGKPKAAELTWGNLVEASKASNRVLSGRVRGRGLWQAVLPFSTWAVFRCLCAASAAAGLCVFTSASTRRRCCVTPR